MKESITIAVIGPYRMWRVMVKKLPPGATHNITHATVYIGNIIYKWIGKPESAMGQLFDGYQTLPGYNDREYGPIFDMVQDRIKYTKIKDLTKPLAY